MRVAVFSTKPYDRVFLDPANGGFGHALTCFEPRLTTETRSLAEGFQAVCVFVNDQLDARVLDGLSAGGTTIVALRSAGFNNVDLAAAERLGVRVVRVPAYSPHAVAEHTVALILALNRKIHRAFARVREGNFSLVGLLGFDLHGRAVGIVGTGRIGAVVARIMAGFSWRLCALDPQPDPACQEMGVVYVSLEELFARSDVIALHCPLTPATHYLVNARSIERMKDGVMLVNTSRGAVIDTRAAIAGLERGKIGSLALEVYEEEGDCFFEDLSEKVISDDVLARLLTFPNVLNTAHPGFFTRDALSAIARRTLANLRDLETTGRSANEVTLATVRAAGPPGDAP